MSEWGKDAVADDDPRFEYGMPSSNNANFAFMQHMIHHAADDGMVGTVMAKGSLSAGGKQGEIREKLVEENLIDAIVVLPDQLFYTTEIPVSLWILSMSKGEKVDSERVRNEETLFIDARDIYEQKDIKQKILTPEQIDKIAGTVRAYREDFSEYEDVDGYCKVADIDEIADNDYSLIPGRYVEVGEVESDDIPFDAKMEELTSKLRDNFRKSDELQEEIDGKLREVGF
jgi:type I restriction enzyme M protein